MKNFLGLVSLGLVVLVCFSACEGHKVVDNKGKMRLINASSITGDVNLDVDYQTIYSSNVQYLNYTYFREYLAGYRKLQIKNSNGSVVIDTAITIMDNKAYSLLVYDSMSVVKFKILDELFVTPQGSECKIRFIHLGNDVGSVSVTKDTNATILFANYSNGDYSNYTSFNAGDHSFKITGDINFAQPIYQAKPGYFYTMYLKGIKASTGADSVGIFTIENNGNYE
ncbi:MAG: DUF4397 domain-containing protein [Chitinophagaceae bacterium]|nr:DUF4397 domain-containing protein [Chitinophagaceae bacterium]